ncbi:MAG: NAD(P)-dependent oxidoreductase [Tateyamaria sp.]|jgi:putative dehydrogenase|nr:NAD(P)-dependent oxidoreductase [Tateyamaria sp.]MBT5302987.1 NAD(P)-dependent oxidoreductase [Tateyamaria sp.]MBT6344104.1 NAD(P)-dependent oxidoreductase [Tateyamaria sp.]MBT7446603.1 NAD(P)-dependent oxidoreductase [Tateyamaria sp.]MBT7800811.1 NAD(P)-dependent oxidoreductase [Tateyamaria sp.]
MTSVGVVGLGDMGSGIARNLIKNGFETWGIDLIPDRNESFAAIGGNVAETVAEVGRNAQIVFVMVMKGAEAQDVILGVDGLSKNMAVGGVILLTSTVKPSEARSIGTGLNNTGLEMIDSPVSGGYPGAQGGTLTLMVAACDAALEKAKPAMEAVSAAIHRVGTKAGEGQVVKACLQSLIGSIFSATFEAAALAAKAGVPGQVILDVFSTSSAGSGITNNALEKIIDRQFEDTGSHINTMHKDLTISMALGEELGVPLHTAAAAMQIFHAGRTRYPNGDNWICTKVIEEIVGAELHRDMAKVIR